MAIEVLQLAAQAGLSKRYKGADHPDTIAARRALKTAQIADDIGRRLAGEVSLTDEQVIELTSLLRGGIARPVAEMQERIDRLDARIEAAR